MATISKFDELAGEAFLNAMRLHLDSMILYKNGSFPSAHQLAMQSSQEIGKALVLEHLVSQSSPRSSETEAAAITRSLIALFSSQRLMRQQLAKVIRRLAKDPEYRNLSVLLSAVAEQADELEKEKLTYVGLTNRNRKIDLDGKKVLPRLIARKDRVQRQITVNNDFLTVYIAGFLNDVYGVDSDTLAWEMNEDNLRILQIEWSLAGRKSQQILSGFERQKAAEESDKEAARKAARAAEVAAFFEEQALTVAE
jgi:AbiV family abortive infection protein